MKIYEQLLEQSGSILIVLTILHEDCAIASGKYLFVMGFADSFLLTWDFTFSLNIFVIRNWIVSYTVHRLSNSKLVKNGS